MPMPRAALLELPETRWYCPNCPVTDVTRGHHPNRFHQCRGTGIHAGLLAPLVQVGIAAKVTVHEREDFIGSEDVHLHQGRPVMAVRTTREDGDDALVFLPTAHARLS